MFRTVVHYEREPDPVRYQQHVEDYVRPISYGAFRHGKVFGSPSGELEFRYYAEFEWDDMDSFKEAMNSDEIAAAVADATEMGIPFTVHFLSVE